jgi:hypothetical protein
MVRNGEKLRFIGTLLVSAFERFGGHPHRHFSLFLKCFQPLERLAPGVDFVRTPPQFSKKLRI